MGLLHIRFPGVRLDFDMIEVLRSEYLDQCARNSGRAVPAAAKDGKSREIGVVDGGVSVTAGCSYIMHAASWPEGEKAGVSDPSR
jgi:hypothetical protein